MTGYYSHPTATIDAGAQIGENSKIWHYAHIRDGAIIGNDVIVGKSSYIDTNTIIGDQVKIQNLVSVYSGVTIENKVFVGPHVVFTNDLFPRATGDWEITPTLVKQGASIGANSTVICGITIGENALIGAGSVVTKDVPDFALVRGNPARIAGYVCVCARKVLPKDTKTGIHKIQCNHCKRDLEILIS